MSSSLITTLLSATLNKNGATRFVQTNSNLTFNSLLLDFGFNFTEQSPASWDFLKKVFVSLTLRLGADNGGAIPLVSDIPAYDLLALSDYEGGVSIPLSNFVPGKVSRISGAIDLGFYVMTSRDALEVSVNCADVSMLPAESVTFALSTVYHQTMRQHFIAYTGAVPTGADMPYKNVLSAYYIGEKQLNKQIAITTQLGAMPVNIEDAIALANAVGRFEQFTRFAEVFRDAYGLSQDITLRVPTDDVDSTLLIKQCVFNPAMLASTESTAGAEKASLIAQIRENDSEKYKYLVAAGLI